MIAREQLKKWIVAGCVGVTCLSGCKPTERFRAWKNDTNVSYFQDYVTQIEYPDVAVPLDPQLTSAPLPNSIENPSELPTYDLTLQEAITQALQSSDVLRNLGGSVVSTPQALRTQLDPAMTDLDPLFGTEAALSAFDAQVSSQLFFQRNERPQNNSFGALFPTTQLQNTGNYINQIQKRTASGSTFALRTNVLYDRNNSPTRIYPSDFTGFIEAEWRQPLLLGAGTSYNRIVGPFGGPGQYRGVVVARIDTDISLADFESGVVQLINDVEGAYWELYYAYRALEAQAMGRESSLKTWQLVNEFRRVGRKGGELDAEGQARSNYYSFTAQLNDSLAGPNGLYAAEQRLRYVMGLAPSDGTIMKPIDEPLQAEVEFEWDRAVADALTQRVEIRRQEWVIKRREMELIGSRLTRKPQLDILSQYRWRGLGDHLIDSRDPNNSRNSLVQSIVEGDYQEWQTGLEWRYNVGLRQSSAAVKHAQLTLARELAILKEQQLKVSHDLSNAARQISRSFLQMQTNYNRIEADVQAVDALRQQYETGLKDITFLLQAQQRLAASTSEFYRSLVDYNLSLRDFHREKGSLLAYNQVNLSEEPLSGGAVQAAYDRGRYFTPRDNPEQVHVDSRVSNGAYDPSSVGIPTMASQPVTTTEVVQ